MSLNSLELIALILSPILTTAVAWGALREKLAYSNDRIQTLENRVQEHSNFFVSMNLFNTTVQRIYSDQQELRQDLKRILEILSHRD